MRYEQSGGRRERAVGAEDSNATAVMHRQTQK